MYLWLWIRCCWLLVGLCLMTPLPLRMLCPLPFGLGFSAPYGVLMGGVTSLSLGSVVQNIESALPDNSAGAPSPEEPPPPPPPITTQPWFLPQSRQ
jgi:hypothetical protein